MAWDTLITIGISAITQIGLGAYWIGTITTRIAAVERYMQEHITIPTRVSVLETKFDHIAESLDRIEKHLAQKD